MREVRNSRRSGSSWVEYCNATKGKWVVTGLEALRKIYPTPEAEITDEEAVTKEQDGTLVAFVDGDIWRAARRQKRQPVIAQALTALETGGVAAMVAVLANVAPGKQLVSDRRVDGIPVIEWKEV